MLIVLAGLPGVGKTTIARALAERLDAVHVRIDEIEHRLRSSVLAEGEPMDDMGYVIGRAEAIASLALGRIVIADSVNPWPETRDGWIHAARRVGRPALEVEVICSDRDEHRRRVDTRAADIPGFTLPTWQEVAARDYRPWARDRTIVDTARLSVDECVDAIRAAMGCA